MVIVHHRTISYRTFIRHSGFPSKALLFLRMLSQLKRSPAERLCGMPQKYQQNNKNNSGKHFALLQVLKRPAWEHRDAADAHCVTWFTRRDARLFTSNEIKQTMDDYCDG